MEVAPTNKAFRLTKAKTDSYAAAIASNEAAANEYSKAAEDVEDGEALRALKLLEEHHKRLVALLRSTEQHPQNKSASSEDAPLEQHEEDGEDTTSNVPKRTPSPESRRKPREYAASSLATDLASARGIPYAQQQKQRNSSPYSAADRLRAQRQGHTRPESRTSPKQVDASQPSRDLGKTALRPSSAPSSQDTANDAAFQKFYSTFEGLFSKLSAPLAFAGLPLNAAPADDPQADQMVSAEKVHSAPEMDVDVNKLYSKAAIKALQDENGAFPGVQESFLVVPGTSSTPYGKLSGTRNSLDDEGQELFVDAQDNLSPSLPTTARRSTGGKGSATNKTIEELELENAQLKQLTDKISRRLYDWEKMAQKQGAVLQQSIRMSGSVVGTGPAASSSKSQQEADARVAELEGQLRAAQKEVERNGRENDKLKGVVVRYRERWDKLKEGARNRRESSEQGNGS